MYEKFFGFKVKPFEITPDPDFFYSSENHKEALAYLQYSVREGKGFTVITGEAGSGKTTLVHTLLSQLDGTVKTAYIFNPMMEPAEFLKYICEDLGLDPNKSNGQTQLSQLHKHLLDSYEKNERVFLIIDEAQTLSDELLHQVRLLTNLETSKNKLLHVILIGQPELDQMLEEKQFRPLKQRISVRYYLQPLNSEDVSRYINYRLKRAGARNLRLFYPDAVKSIAKYSNGIPRLINSICDNALLAGFSMGLNKIDRSLIDEVAGDLKIGKENKKANYRRIAFFSIFILLIALAAAAATLFRSELIGIYRFITGWL